MNTKTIFDILSLLLVHWLADYVFQSDWMAANKSRLAKALWAHTIEYTVIVGVWVWVFAGSATQAGCFALVTLLIHTAQDYASSRVVAELTTMGDRYKHARFNAMGLDQLLHAVQLILTLHFVKILIAP
jgi:hypothetical protein